MSSRGTNAEISEGIMTLAKSNAKLERMLAKIGTKADTSDFRDRMHQEQVACTQLIKHTLTLIKNAKLNDSRSQLIQNLTLQFDKEFKRFTSLNGSMDQRQISVLHAVEQHKNDTDDHSEKHPLNTNNNVKRYSDQVTLDLDPQFLKYDVDEIERRHREINEIEQDVVEVSEMYKDLHLMVAEQQESIDSIDANITQTRNKTEAASQQLLEAEEYQKKSRKKKCCLLFLILFVIGIVVMIVFVSK